MREVFVSVSGESVPGTTDLMFLGAALLLISCSLEPPKPTKAQIAWHEREFIGFLHFTTNTFTDREWGQGDEAESVFNPTDFSASQIVGTAKKAGMKQLILTCKHHDGFCLWPTKTTTHNVTRSPFKRDVVKLISDECRKQGLAFGVYLSPWDRNNAYYGKPEYPRIYREQLRELLTNYGSISEVWFDGANGGDGYYGGARETRKIDAATYYGWPETHALVRRLAPDAVMFSDAGPDVRWVGNESGYAGDPCWATYTPHGPNGEAPAPGQTKWQEGENGHRDGRFWIPAECDVSIRPGWFWHESENDKVKSPDQLKELYFKSVGRGAVFLLNIPPDRRGRIHENDIKSLVGFRLLVDECFARDLAGTAKTSPKSAMPLIDGNRRSHWNGNEVTLSWDRAIEFNTLRLREAIKFGQRIGSLEVSGWFEGRWRTLALVQSVGNCRLIQCEPVSTTRLRIRVTESMGEAKLSEVGVFLDPNEAP
ncbi:MAG: alpha-L-fucosidase [Chthonomonadaceae bacterium]|nr:alpha-L-fucosidase [Chthonomonadaceae bacterium]